MTFIIAEHFDVDDWPPEMQRAFALGVEWHQFLMKLAGGAPFRSLAAKGNRVRLVRLAERNGRFVEWHPVSELLVEIIVGNRSKCP